MDIEAISALMKKRRAIFPNSYTSEVIPDEEIMKVLENANWAPTHKRTEPWRFKIFKGESKKKLSVYLGDYYMKNVEKDQFSEVKYKKTLQKPMQSSHVIAICMYINPSVKLPEWEEVAAVACAVQNMWLSCTALGIGAYWSSPKSILEARDFLELEENEKCLGLFYMGYTSIEMPGKRGNIEDKVKWM